MSWLQKLYETCEICYGHEPDGSGRILPTGHTTQQAQVEIVLDGRGRLRRASMLEKEHGTTLIPCTEASGGRSGSKPVSHPLCDKLQYLAADFVAHGGEVTSGFAHDPGEPHRDYLSQLSAWAASAYGHPKLEAILRYVRRGRVMADLVEAKILPVDRAGQLARQWAGDKDRAPPIFKALSPGRLPADAFVRWRVEDKSEASGTWEDVSLRDAWIEYYATTPAVQGYCMVAGKVTRLAGQHPAKLRHGTDKAKLISTNGTSGFTFRGRFTDAAQAVGVGYEVTQKAHNALRWLIERQGSRRGSQTIVSWSIEGIDVPDPMMDTFQGLAVSVTPAGDPSAGEIFAKRLRLAINGYRARLDGSEGVQILALDSATPGRMSITFYRELSGSEFLQRLEDWHQSFAWPQDFGKDLKFIGAPSPQSIAEAAYGQRVDEKLEALTRERLLPCIVEGVPVHRDLVDATRRRFVANRVAMVPRWEWEKCLGIACSLFKGLYRERAYQMTLETDRTSRDYLFGRLLALAENIEGFALRDASEQRATNAARLMQHFADRPYTTWRTLELQLSPYKIRLRSRAPGFLISRERQLDAVLASFDPEQFCSNSPLTAEFLLGYHCQRSHLYAGVEEDAPPK
ncbi:CRISPR-associated protein Csd1 [Paraburkholderia sp. WC7.3g]|uniref:type I-C CRISPR-associated protein Cas8c/Csd1 n=1 Tax=Paraburkholderia sp. WC7.3g TaxID=2991070 RepID=UPI003D257928